MPMLAKEREVRSQARKVRSWPLSADVVEVERVVLKKGFEGRDLRRT